MHGKSTCSKENPIRLTKALEPITRRLAETFRKLTWTIRLIRKLFSWDHCHALQLPQQLTERYRKTYQLVTPRPKSTQHIPCLLNFSNHRLRRWRHSQLPSSKVALISWRRWQLANICKSMRNNLRSNCHVTCAPRWAQLTLQDVDLQEISCKQLFRPDLVWIPKSQRDLLLSPLSNHL